MQDTYHVCTCVYTYDIHCCFIIIVHIIILLDYVHVNTLAQCHCMYINNCWPSPSNQSFYRQIAGYHCWLMMRGGHGPTKQLQDLNWSAFNHASHALQLRSCNYYLFQSSPPPNSIQMISKVLAPRIQQHSIACHGLYMYRGTIMNNYAIIINPGCAQEYVTHSE